jgi:hypothetical protein
MSKHDHSVSVIFCFVSLIALIAIAAFIVNPFVAPFVAQFVTF